MLITAELPTGGSVDLDVPETCGSIAEVRDAIVCAAKADADLALRHFDITLGGVPLRVDEEADVRLLYDGASVCVQPVYAHLRVLAETRSLSECCTDGDADMVACFVDAWAAGVVDNTVPMCRGDARKQVACAVQSALQSSATKDGMRDVVFNILESEALLAQLRATAVIHAADGSPFYDDIVCLLVERTSYTPSDIVFDMARKGQGTLLRRLHSISSWNPAGLRDYKSVIEHALPHPDTTRVLLEEYGGDANAHSQFGSLLMAAVREGAPESVTLLLDHGADVHAERCNGTTALSEAARLGRCEAAAVLVDRGAKTQERNRTFGWTPLMVAAFYGHADIVADLCEEGGVDWMDFKGRTALCLAAEAGRCQAVRVLLQHKADPTVGWGAKPLEAACRRLSFKKSWPIVKALLLAGAPSYEEALDWSVVRHVGKRVFGLGFGKGFVAPLEPLPCTRV